MYHRSIAFEDRTSLTTVSFFGSTSLALQLYPYNLTLPILGDLINKVDGTLKLTYTSVNGVVLLDFILKVSQNETEHREWWHSSFD